MFKGEVDARSTQLHKKASLALGTGPSGKNMNWQREVRREWSADSAAQSAAKKPDLSQDNM